MGADLGQFLGCPLLLVAPSHQDRHQSPDLGHLGEQEFALALGEIERASDRSDSPHDGYFEGPAGVPAVVPHIQSGRLRAIAIGSLKRFTAIPEVPTFDESGVKGYEATTWFGLMAPVKTPKEIVARWNIEVGKILTSPDLKGRFINEGLEPMGGTQEEFTKFIRSEIEKYAKVVVATGMKPQ